MIPALDLEEGNPAEMRPPGIEQGCTLAPKFAGLLATHGNANRNVALRHGGNEIETRSFAGAQSERVVDVAGLDRRQIEDTADQQQRRRTVASSGMAGHQAGG